MSEDSKGRKRDVEIHGNGNIVGDHNVSVVFKPVVRFVQSIDRAVFERLGLEQRLGFLLVGLLVVGVGVGLYLGLRPRVPSMMSGDFRIAVAGFSVEGNSEDGALGRQLAEGVYLRLVETFEDADLDFGVVVWGPERVGSIEASGRERRAQEAEALAQSIGADIVVYGVVDTTGVPWRALPEFYVNSQNFHEAREITGQHDIGMSVSLRDQGGIVGRIDVGDQLDTRVQVLSRITVGLAYYAIHDYETALRYFVSTEEVSGWTEEEGKHVVYLLAGNAAGKSDDLDVAEAYYEKALALDPEYSRAYIGLASTYYMRALEPFRATQEPTDTDLEWLDQSVLTYQRALEASYQPALSDVETRVHFGLGQCYLMQVYSRGDSRDSFDAALTEFARVIDEYGEGQNPRVRDLAAESHARIGLIYALSARPQEAIDEYKTAVSLLDDNPQQRDLYQRAIRDLTEREIVDP